MQLRSVATQAGGVGPETTADPQPGNPGTPPPFPRGVLRTPSPRIHEWSTQGEPRGLSSGPAAARCSQHLGQHYQERRAEGRLTAIRSESRKGHSDDTRSAWDTHSPSQEPAQEAARSLRARPARSQTSISSDSPGSPTIAL